MKIINENEKFIITGGVPVNVPVQQTIFQFYKIILT